jgi:hypothetical protein
MAGSLYLHGAEFWGFCLERDVHRGLIWIGNAALDASVWIHRFLNITPMNMRIPPFQHSFHRVYTFVMEETFTITRSTTSTSAVVCFVAIVLVLETVQGGVPVLGSIPPRDNEHIRRALWRTQVSFRIFC